MVEFVGWIGDVLAVEIATVGTTVVTLGLVIALTMISGAALSIGKRLRSR